MKLILSLACAAFALTALPAAAQTVPDPEADARMQARGEAYSRAEDSEQDPAELERTRLLNAEIAARNLAAEEREAADNAAYAAALEASALAEEAYRRDVAAAETARANHQAAVSAADAARMAWEADRAAWLADCRARHNASACVVPD